MSNTIFFISKRITILILVSFSVPNWQRSIAAGILSERVLDEIVLCVSNDFGVCSNVDLIAFSTKADKNSFPPFIYSEALVVAQIRESWVLTVLHQFQYRGSEWIVANDRVLRNTQSFKHRPSKAEMIDFLKKSSFAGGEYKESVALLLVTASDDEDEEIRKFISEYKADELTKDARRERLNSLFMPNYSDGFFRSLVEGENGNFSGVSMTLENHARQDKPILGDEPNTLWPYGEASKGIGNVAPSKE